MQRPNCKTRVIFYTVGPSSRKGSVMLSVILVTLVLASGIGFLLDYTINSYRNAVRQQRLNQVRLAAENEMEFLYFNWKAQSLLLPSPDNASSIPSTMAALTFRGDPISANTSVTDPLTLSYSPCLGDQSGYTVGRGMRFLSTQRGVIPGTTKTGRVSSFVVQTIARLNDPMVGNLTYKVGRRFIYSDTSLFQYSVFYQGDMEFSTGTNMTLEGDISSNSSIYLAARDRAGANLTVKDKVRYTDMFNGSTNPTDGTQLVKYGSGSTYKDAVFTYDSTPLDTTDPIDQAAARAHQVERNSEQENFLGGADITGVLARYPDAYSDGVLPTMTDAEKKEIQTNNVYRSVIAPPPLDVANNPIPEDPTIANQRMYNKAGFIIKVDGSGTGTLSVTIPGDTSGHDYGPKLAALGVFPSGEQRKSVYDAREGVEIKMTSVDISKLITALNSSDSDMQALKAAYNGVVYAYDTNAKGTGYEAGVRLINAEATPNYNDTSGNPLGFTFATNNGLYVQGNFNTYLNSGARNSTALMGDAVTVLSKGWTDTSDPASGYGDHWADSSTAVGDLAASGYTTVVAAIISGNTPSTPTNSSGGVQNLVRFLENWEDADQSVKFDGSLAQLFTSKYFNHAYVDPADGPVYTPPRNRVFAFDKNLANNRPRNTPTTTTLSRGDYFTW